jgi:hypothetical protein
MGGVWLKELGENNFRLCVCVRACMQGRDAEWRTPNNSHFAILTVTAGLRIAVLVCVLSFHIHAGLLYRNSAGLMAL